MSGKDRNGKQADLRRRAEAELASKGGTVPITESPGDPFRLIHELQVHQVELEMQNEELRRTREEIESLLGRYTDLYEFAPVGYFTLDRAGTIRSVNLTGAGLLGLDRSRMTGQRFEGFVAAGARSEFAAFLAGVFAGRQTESCETELRLAGDETLFGQMEAVAGETGEECRIALIDITGRKRSEEALRRSKEAAESLRLEKEAAEASDRAKSLFLANISHELRTPMTGILGMLQIALENDLAPEPREHLEATFSSAHSLLRIINDILDMAKVDAGKLSIVENPFTMQLCIAEAVGIIAPEARRKGLDLDFRVDEAVPETLVGDQLRLRQVLINLIGNAVKFTSQGGITVTASAGGTAATGKRLYAIAVKDTGIGIPDDKRAFLFKAFSQIDESHSRSFGGAGLGLIISRRIAELMGGTISFTSKEGEGSVFTFTVPLAAAPLESAGRTIAEQGQIETSHPVAEEARATHILLAEDEQVIRNVLGIMFKRAHYDLDFAEDGLKAVKMWEKGEYDLVLMDVQMPGFDGFEATRAIREKELVRGGHTPIVAMTAHAFKEDETKCLEAGMDAYISKPIDFRKSLRMIENILKGGTGKQAV